MLPFSKRESYFKFTPGVNELGNTMRVESGPNSHQLFGTIPNFAQLLANEGNNLIIDEVLLDDESLISYAKKLSKHRVYYIGIFCDLEIMQMREILRRDRDIGLSNDQLTRVHQGLRTDYDFQIDTSNISPFEAARQILGYVERNVNPRSFKDLIKGNKV